MAEQYEKFVTALNQEFRDRNNAPLYSAPTVAVESVSLNKTSITCVLAETSQIQLSAVIVPEDASNKNITWSSSNNSIATVSQEGLVTIISKGSVSITVTTEDGNKTATCAIMVREQKQNQGGKKMGLSIVECGSLKEYLTRTAAEVATGDYLYLNKFNHSMIFSDNGAKALLSDPLNAPYATIYIAATATGEKTGDSAANACDFGTALMITPKNAAATWVFVGSGFDVAGYAIDGFSNLSIDFTNFDSKITGITNSKVNITAGNVAIDNITNSVVVAPSPVVLTVKNIKRSNVSASDIEQDATTAVVTASDNSSVIMERTEANITADKNSHVVIGDLVTGANNVTLSANLGSTITYILDENGDETKIVKSELLLGRVVTVEVEDTSTLVQYIQSSLEGEPEEEEPETP